MKAHPITHPSDGKTDPRHPVQLEWCGYKERRYVARFCGDWVGQSLSYPAAVLILTGHRLQRAGAQIIICQLA